MITLIVVRLEASQAVDGDAGFSLGNGFAANELCTKHYSCYVERKISDRQR